MADNEVKHKPLQVDGKEIASDQVFVLQPTYILDEREYEILISSDTGLKEWSKRFLLISLGWIVKVFSVLVVFFFIYYQSKPEERNGIKPEIENWEIVSILIALIIYLVLLLFGFLVKSKKDKLIKEISSHYQLIKRKR